MSLTRAALIFVQAVANGLVCTPPNPTSQKQRYHTEEMYILQIAPLIFKCHQMIAYLCATFEVLYYLRAALPSYLPAMFLPSPTSSIPMPLNLLSTAICPVPPSPSLLRITPSFLIGILAVLLGSYIRLDCFKALGPLFTFDLTVHPNHQLITTRFYAYVRHPAYTGSMLLVAGLALSHLTSGSWMTECGPLSKWKAAPIVVWASWWLWTFCVGISRADAEDRQMKQLFKEEWEVYAAQVPWWFFPGIV